MKKIGYIISSRKQDKEISFVGKASSMRDVDPTKPVLIIGWKQAQKEKDYKSILSKQLSPLKWWTFSRIEKRSDYVKDCEEFYQTCIDIARENTKYYYVNPFKISYSSAKRLLVLLSSKENIIYIGNNMMYSYTNGYVFGVSFQILNYIGISIKKLYGRLYRNKSNKIYKDDNDEVRELKQYLQEKSYYLIPYLLEE